MRLRVSLGLGCRLRQFLGPMARLQLGQDPGERGVPDGMSRDRDVPPLIE
jgi:hypothetical protein